MRPVLTRFARALPQFPATVAAAIFASGALILHLQTLNEPAFPAPWIGVGFWLAFVAAMALAERLLGTFTALLAGAVSSAAALLAAWGALTLGSRLGDSFSIDALQHPLWASSIATVALLGAASARLRPVTRTSVRWFTVGAAVVLLLANGHAADVARVLAAAFGIVAGSIGLRGDDGWTWGTSTRARLRRITSAVLILAGASVVTTLVAPDANGISASLSFTLDPPATVAVGVALIASALLVLSGRRLALASAIGILLTVAIVLTVTAVQAIADDDGFQWAGLTPDEIDWEITVFAVSLLPAVIAVVLAGCARVLLRKKARPASAGDRDRLDRAVAQADGGSLAHMSTWAGNSVWFSDDGAAVAYRVSRGVAFTVSDPICAPERTAGTLRDFAVFCEGQGWVPVFYSVHDAVADHAAGLGWVRTPVGVEAVVPLDGFSLSGKRRQDLRTALNRAGREGVEARWGRFADLPDELRRQVAEICTSWQSTKALPEMTFTLGGLDELADPRTRLMIAVDGAGRVHGVTSWLPVSRAGRPFSWTLDVMRRGQDAIPGTMEFLIVSTILRAKDDGLHEVSLSGTPLAPHDARRTALSRLSATLERILEPAYGFVTLRRFKEKFAPETRPLWMVYPQHTQLPRIGPALAQTYVPSLRVRHLMRLGGMQSRAGVRRSAW
ncbi:bifunctional lysylphosphatidylglycerol flippase/synthetase MprF [Leifsonia shinshuensis]